MDLVIVSKLSVSGTYSMPVNRAGSTAETFIWTKYKHIDGRMGCTSDNGGIPLGIKAPHYSSADRDAIYGSVVIARMAAMGIRGQSPNRNRPALAEWLCRTG